MQAKETVISIKLISDKATIGVCQLIHNISYQPLCSRDKVLKCREHLKKELCVSSNFSSDTSSAHVADQAYLYIKHNHVVAMRIAVGVLTSVKADAIVVPTGRATAQHMYPIELPHLRESYSKQLCNDTCELSEENNFTVSLESSNFIVIHTLFPIQEQESVKSHDLAVATLEHSIQEGVGSISYPGINTQMLKSLADGLIQLTPTTLHTVNVVVDTKEEAKVYTEALKALISESKLPSSFLWLWEEDHGLFTQYAQKYADELNVAYRSDPTGVCYLNIGDWRYKVNFKTMKQMNLHTHNERRIRRKAVGKGDDQNFFSYTPEISPKIEERNHPSRRTNKLYSTKAISVSFAMMS